VEQGGWMVGSKQSTPRVRGRLATALGFAAAAIVLSGWLLASPPGSSPDDEYHLTSIWCSRGFVDGICLENPGAPSWDRKTLVPFTVARISCFAYERAVSAACTLDILGTDPARFTPGIGGNVDGERAQLYYWTMHAFVSDDFPSAMARIRVTNVVLTLAMLAGTLAFAPPAVRRSVALTWLIASLPLGLFLLTSLNTTAWGLIGLGTLWANVLSALTGSERRQRFGAAMLAIAGATMALGSRTEALGHTVVTLAAIGVFHLVAHRARADRTLRSSRLLRSTLLFRASIGVIAIGAVTFALRRLPSLDYLSGASRALEKGNTELVRRGFGQPVLALLLETPQLWTGAFGDRWGLGWIDTPMPPVTSLAALSVFVMLVVLGLRHADRGRIGAALIVVAGLIVLPVFSLMYAGLVVGEELQPRHYMVLLFVLAGIALTPSPGRSPLELGPGQRVTIVTLLGLGHAAALHTNMMRYVAGLTDARYVDLNSTIEWWWADMPSPMTVWVVASVAYIVLAGIILGMFREGALEEDGLSPPAARS
jgi:hypothetical protein